MPRPAMPIYLDHGASTPVDPRVVEAMRPFWERMYANPMASHELGRDAHLALEQARESAARLFNVRPSEIVFTGGGSESDNLALRGTMLAARQAGRGNHLIISAIEHSAIRATAEQLNDLFDFDVSVVGVDEFGRVDVEEVADAIRPSTVLISIMAANNEIGTLQPIDEIGELARERQVLFHTDAVQAAANQRWNLAAQPIDLLSVAAHKFYGPKGVGMLIVRDDIELVPMITGGGQEEGRRAGTSNVPGIVGMAKALELASAEMETRLAHAQTLRDRLIDGLTTALPDDCVLTGHPTERLPHNASFALRHVSGNELLMHLDMAGIAASSGSACKTGNPKPSATLRALGLSDEWTKGGLRLTVGKQNSAEDIEYVLETLPTIVAKLQKLYALTHASR